LLAVLVGERVIMVVEAVQGVIDAVIMAKHQGVAARRKVH
jgi:hypothetical protein